MANNKLNETTLADLLYQALETERGGIKVYETAITCAVTDYLRQEWTENLVETRHQEQVLLGIFDAFGLDPKSRPHSGNTSSGIGAALVVLMNKAKDTVTPEQAEMVAWEAVALADRRSDPATLQPGVVSGNGSRVPLRGQSASGASGPVSL